MADNEVLWGTVVITNDQELAVTQQRIRQFHESCNGCGSVKRLRIMR